jgi:hypothetical protein
MSLIPHCFGETFVSLWSVLVLGSTTSAFARRFRESAFWPTVGQCAIVLRHLRRTARIYEDVLFSDYDTHSALPLSLKKILELIKKFAVFGRMLSKLVIFRIPSFESIFTSRRCRESSIQVYSRSGSLCGWKRSKAPALRSSVSYLDVNSEVLNSTLCVAPPI